MIRIAGLAVFVFLPTPILAQEAALTVRGTVKSVDENKRRIMVDGRRYHVGEDCKIWLNYETVTLASVQANQEVELTYVRYPGGRREAKILKIEKNVATAVRSEAAGHAPKGPELFPSMAKPGDTGALATKNPGTSFQVFQIVGKKDVLLKGDGVTFRLQGFPTESMTEGKTVELPGYFKATGKDTYETSTGSKTVLVIEPVSESERKKIEDTAQAKARDSAASQGAQKKEDEAGKKLRLAKQLLDHQQVETARARLSQIVEEFSGTKAAKEAERMLEKMH